MADSEPTFSVQVGLTISPKPYESVRVDIGYQNVSADTVEQAIAEGRPVVERLFSAALTRALVAAEGAKDGLYPGAKHITNAAGPSAITGDDTSGEFDSPPPVGKSWKPPVVADQDDEEFSS